MGGFPATIGLAGGRLKGSRVMVAVMRTISVAVGLRSVSVSVCVVVTHGIIS